MQSERRVVDSASLTLVSTFVQTVVITLTLVVFIFQFRSQEKAIREASYQNLLGRYNDFMMNWTDDEDLLLNRLVAPGGELDKKDLSTIRRHLLSYGIIEEAYELYKKGWIDEESWEQWNSWLRALAGHPHFGRLHAAAAGMYDKDFQEHVTRLLGSGAPGD